MSVPRPSGSELPPSKANGGNGHAVALSSQQEWQLRGAERAVHLLNRKWVLPVINALWTGGKRHRELREDIPGICDKVLTETLRFLEQDGIVARIAVSDMPPFTRYQLTELGRTLGFPLQSLTLWALEHGTDGAHGDDLDGGSR